MLKNLQKNTRLPKHFGVIANGEMEMTKEEYDKKIEQFKDQHKLSWSIRSIIEAYTLTIETINQHQKIDWEEWYQAVVSKFGAQL